ncbi:MAG: transposase [Betaproteobacteria bacterium]|nr:transposase [Betaproteobacteria bacterium]
MPNYRRSRVPGGSYFFTVVTHGRRPYFESESARLALFAALREIRHSHPFRIDAWVLLPDHIHTIWTLPANDSDFSQRWARIKRITSNSCRQLVDRESMSSQQIANGENGFWQRRFWEHQIRDEADFAAHTDYIHRNPVKHGLVERPMDWPYSSFQRYLAKRVYPADWATAAPNGSVSFGE